MGVHDVDRHLHRVEVEVVFLRDLEHAQVDERVLVAGEADEAELALLPGVEEGFHRAVLLEDAVRVFHADDLVVLDEVEMIRAEAGHGFLDLAHGGLLGAPVDFGHLENLVAAVVLLVSLARAEFAGAQVVVPGVVHEGDAVVDGSVDEPDGLGLGARLAEMEAAHADQADHDARGAERAVDHIALAGFAFHRAGQVRERGGRGDLRVDGVGFFRSVGVGDRSGGGVVGHGGAGEGGSSGGETGGGGTGGFEEGAAGGVHREGRRMKAEGSGGVI